MMKHIAMCLLVLLVAYSAAACTTDPGRDLDSAHETIPHFRPHESQDFGFEVQRVELSSDGQVLIEGFAQGNTAALELHVHHGEAVDQDGHVVAGRAAPIRGFVLVEHLQLVVVDIAFVYQVDILVGAVVAL